MISLILSFWIIASAFAFEYETINSILHNKHKRLPNENASKALDVKLGFYLESIGNFRAGEMSFDVDMYAYMSWTDPRLQHNFSDVVLVNDDEIRKQIWLPDLYFANAIQSKVHEVTVPNFNMFIARDGTVAYSCRFTMQISCNLQLQNYPMDVQKCGIRILSYAYIAKQVNVSWFDTNPMRYNPDIGLPEFRITNVSASYCNGTYRYAVMKNRYKIDDFSCLTGNIFLSRSIGYNLVQSYIPTGLIVIISWVSFWIDRRAVPARVTLSFTTLVSLTTLGNGLRFGLPQVSYAKAIDLWFGACMIFVFCALLEFAIINSYMRKAEKYGEMAKKFMHSRVNTAERSDDIKIPMGSPQNEHRQPNLSQKKSPKSTRDPIPKSPRIGTKPVAMQSVDFVGSISSYDNLTPINRRNTRHLRREELDISDDDEAMFDKAVLRRDKPYVVYSTEEGTSVFYNADKQKQIERAKLKSQHARRQSKFRLSVCENAYATMAKSFSRTALVIDKACRYLFPLAFVLWNLFYWWYYLLYAKNKQLQSLLD